MARAPVSKTGGWGFESLHSCQAKVFYRQRVSRRRLIGLAGASSLLALAGQAAWSQASRTIKFVVPFPAGGAADLLTRVLTQQIGTSGGVTTVVENRPGAASIVGTE
jgi:tripartite-type tricarboxylate transporter receptor subunit TctC